jgi:retron-type reverse transcriptase
LFRGGGSIHSFYTITSFDNILSAWQRFSHDKHRKQDVIEFNLKLIDNLHQLHNDLRTKAYTHSQYTHFIISDPKKRDIHKSSVRDRIIHHVLYHALYPYFDKKFIHDSYSCRINKGTHRALYRFREFSQKCSQNNTKTCWVLKCDIKKFFASIDHVILKQILRKYLDDADTIRLLENIIDSFHTTGRQGIGLPLGNLTSQLLVNIYMNEFDQFVKHYLKQKYYIRYADDFVFFSDNRKQFETILPHIREFLWEHLRLELHPNKVFIKTVASGVDFLGWVHFLYHRVLRTATKRRMIKKLRSSVKPESITSYRGMLSHGNSWKLQRKYLEGKPF